MNIKYIKNCENNNLSLLCIQQNFIHALDFAVEFRGVLLSHSNKLNKEFFVKIELRKSAASCMYSLVPSKIQQYDITNLVIKILIDLKQLVKCCKFKHPKNVCL